jgi:hypothetical protein
MKKLAYHAIRIEKEDIVRPIREYPDKLSPEAFAPVSKPPPLVRRR